MSAPGLARAAARALDPWNHSVGLAWADVLRAARLDPRSTVAEVGPGFTDKVGHGLAELRFRGTVVLIEPTESARSWATERYRTLLPAARIVGVPTSVADARRWTELDVDAVVANHVLDDMLLYAAVGPAARDALFGGMRPDAPCAAPFVNAWNELMAEPDRLERAAASVVDDLTRYVLTTRPRIVAIREYPSWTHRVNGLAFIHTQSLSLMRDLQARLVETGLRRLRVPERGRPHDPADWLLMSWTPRP